MSIFDDILAQDAAFAVNPELAPGAESVTYKPVLGAAAMTFDAVVNRLPPEVDPGSGAVVHHITVFVPNHATLGVTSVNTSGDRIHLPRRQGGTAEDLKVAEILTQDAGGWLLLLR